MMFCILISASRSGVHRHATLHPIEECTNVASITLPSQQPGTSSTLSVTHRKEGKRSFDNCHYQMRHLT